MPTVLVIEDSKFSRTQTCKALRHARFDVLEAPDGNEGLQVVRTQSVDCIVTDLIMPVIDGLSLIRKLRSAGVRAPIIAYTADEQALTREACAAAGATLLVLKRSGVQALCEQVAGVLSARREAA